MANEKRLDLIDRGELANEISKIGFVSVGNVLQCLSDAPTVDAVEVVHGRWILEQEYGNGTADYKCSVCDYDDTFPIGNFTYGKYCPNCGAKMDGGNEDG